MSNQSIGARLKELRQSAGLTQRALAKKIGVSQAGIGRLESEGDYITSRPTIIALAQALNCDPDWLEKGEGPKVGQSKTMKDVHAQDKAMNAFLKSLPHDVRDALSEYSLAISHYKDLETLFAIALQTRTPLADEEAENEFQAIFRNWARRSDRGREAINHATDLLEQMSNLKLAEYQLAKAQIRRSPK